MTCRISIQWLPLLGICLAVLAPGLHADAATIAEFTFDNEANPTENTGIGPDGVLLDGATVENGRLVVNGLDQGLDIPLGSLSPFGGGADWSVSFDFETSGDSGALFSSDGSAEPFPGGQEGALNIFMSEGTVLMDFWFIGAIESGNGEYNDGNVHTLDASYDAATGIATLTLDGADTVMSEEWTYSRDASMDRTRVGDETNGDFGGEFNPVGFVGSFDNVVIEGVPEPSTLVLFLVGVLAATMSLRGRRS